MSRWRILVLFLISAVGLMVSVPALAATGTSASSGNLSDNPILARNMTGYSIQEGGTNLLRVPVTDHVVANFAAQVTSTASTTRIRTPREPVESGQQRTFASDVKPSQTGTSGHITVSWYASSGAFLSWSPGPVAALSNSNWTRISATLKVPANAASAVTVVNVFGLKNASTVAVTQHDVRSPTNAPLPSASPSVSTSPAPPPPATSTGALRNLPPQPASLAYGGSNVGEYARPGGLVASGRDNYQNQGFKDVSAAGGTVLIYLDPIIDNKYGRYHSMLNDASVCGPSVSRWPGNYQANQWGYLNDFRPGGLLQGKLECVLETMVAENPHMAGWLADDLGSRSWFPGFNWSSFPDKLAYRNGAIQISQTFRKVANRHGLIFIVNGTWSANDGGGYPDVAKHGNALADGGFVEHHDGRIGFFGPYGCSKQWAAQSPVTKGAAFNWAVTDTAAGRREYVNSGCYAYVNEQTSSRYDYAPPWGSFHPTGLPSRVADSVV